MFKNEDWLYLNDSHILSLKVYASSLTQEVSNDVDDDKGGLYTSSIADGWNPYESKTLTIPHPDGKDITQTTLYHHLYIKTWKQYFDDH